jgi:hypothetical protein
VHIVIVDALLGLGVLNQLQPGANNLWVFLYHPLPILCSIERHFELIWGRYETLSPVLANWLATAHTQHFISHIFHLAQPGCEILRIEVKDISDNCLLFSWGELVLAVASLREIPNSLVLVSQRWRGHLKCLSSESEAFKLADIIGRKRKLNSTFFVRGLRVELLRHVALMEELVTPSNFDRGDGVTGVMVEYGSSLKLNKKG